MPALAFIPPSHCQIDFMFLRTETLVQLLPFFFCMNRKWPSPLPHLWSGGGWGGFERLSFVLASNVHMVPS